MLCQLKFILPCSHDPAHSFYAVQAGTSANIYPDGEADSVLLSDRTDAAADIASLFSGIDATHTSYAVLLPPDAQARLTVPSV